jgi:tetratricopeptide (TPR) repeat protein
LALVLERTLKPRLTAAVIVVALVYFAGSSVAMNRVWRTEETLWSHSVRHGGDATAHLNLAMSLADRRDPRVRHHLEEAIRLSPNYALAHLNLGLLLIDLGQPEAGLAECLTAVRLAPNWGDTHYWLARAYLTLGRPAEAASASARAAQLDPRNLRYQYQAALDAQRVGDYAGSLAYLRAIEQIDAGYYETLFAKGFALWQLNRPDAAVEAYRAFLARQPAHVQAQFNLGYTLMTMGRYAEAIPPFEQALRLKPNYNEAHLHLATCYERVGNAEAAARHRALYQQSR